MPSAHTSYIVQLALTVSLLFGFFIIFFSFYFCHCRARNVRRSRRNPAIQFSRRLPTFEPPTGLEPSVIASFPTLTYSWVKSLQEGKYGQECAICLGEFYDKDVLRLLTACSHVFHVVCIDIWLKSHTTCPVCRCDLNPPEEPREVKIMVTVDDEQGAVEGTRGDEEEQQQQQSRMSFKENEEGAGDLRGNVEDESRRGNEDLDRLPRSNSGGQSSTWREEHRYMLRLPEDVKARISRQRNWTGSCINLREMLGEHIKDDDDIERAGCSDRGPNRT